MGESIIAGIKIDLCRTFMPQRLFAFVVCELPAGNWCGNDNGLIQETAGKTIFFATVDDRLLQVLFGFLITKLRFHFLRQLHGLRGIFSAMPAVTDKLLAILRERFLKLQMILPTVFKACAYIPAHYVYPQ